MSEKSELQLIDERDAAEQALSQAYFLVMSRSPEWSNLFGYEAALEDIDDAQHTLRDEVATLRAELERARATTLEDAIAAVRKCSIHPFRWESQSEWEKGVNQTVERVEAAIRALNADKEKEGP